MSFSIFGQRADDGIQHRKRVAGAVSLALFKIVARLPHGVCNMGKTKQPYARRTRESVKGRRFHFAGTICPAEARLTKRKHRW